MRKISIKTSDIFTSWKQTDYQQFCKEYQTVKNKCLREIPFKSTKILEQNFTARKNRNQNYKTNKSNTANNMFDQFDDELK